MRSLAAGLALLFSAALILPPQLSAAETELHFPSLNKLHRFSEVETAPVAWGPFRVHLRVPEGELRVLAHRVFLTPLPDGTHRARIVGRFEGNGIVVGHVSALGVSTEQRDDVVLPAQDQTLTGRVRIVHAGDVYRLTTEELPRDAEVRIQSRLGERLTQWCTTVPLLETLGGDCQGVRRAVSSVTVKLPQPGETYEIRKGALTEEERNAVDRYLNGPGRGREPLATPRQ